MKQPPLRYRISNWEQLSDCLSNNSRELHASATEFFNNKELNGLRISVDHEIYGNLFACVINASGSLASCYKDSLDEFKYDDTDYILAQLRKFGFLIKYQPCDRLSAEQIELLKILRKLGFDKIRRLHVVEESHGMTNVIKHLVLFDDQKLHNWLDEKYTTDTSSLMKALGNGNAVDITYFKDVASYNWDWLTYVANIQDIIDSCSPE